MTTAPLRPAPAPRRPPAERRPAPGPGPGPGRAAVPDVEIVVPVHNEVATLAPSVTRLRDHLAHRFPFGAVVTVVDNASTDGTYDEACRLAATVPGVRALRLEQKGRGRAIRAVWGTSPSPVVAYMDVDLSTDLRALLPLVAPLLSGHSDLAIGTRLAHGAHVTRGPKREVLSRGYNLLIRTLLRNRFSDAQCGFKAARADVARALLPTVEDEGWFFDTELLVEAERAGLRIHEVPVDWVDDPDSRVDIPRTVAGDLRGVWRLLGEPVADRRFVTAGIVSTAAYAALFLALLGSLGALAANAVALSVCTAANMALRRSEIPGRLLGSACILALSSALLLALPSGAAWGALAVLGASGLVAAARLSVPRRPARRRARAAGRGAVTSARGRR